MARGSRGNPLYRLDKDLVQVEVALSEISGVPRHLIRNYAYAWGLMMFMASLEALEPRDLYRIYGNVKRMVIERLEDLKKRPPRRVQVFEVS